MGNVSEIIERGDLLVRLEHKVRKLAAEYLSSEFEYIRSGFHFGALRSPRRDPLHLALGRLGGNLGIFLSRMVLLWAIIGRYDSLRSL